MRKKLLIAVSIAVVVAIAAYISRSTPVRVSKATTRITSPLAEDGLPNYVTALLDKEREGVTLENNGAVLFWQAVGPGKRYHKYFRAICDELKIEPDSARKTLVNVDDDEIASRLAEWLSESAAPTDDAEANAPATPSQLQLAKDCLDVIQRRAWTREQFPLLAEWVSENNASLDLLVEASQKERFFSPQPNAILTPDAPVVDLLLSHAQAAREVVRSLAARAMHRLAAGDCNGAWSDVSAVWRLGDLIGSGPTTVERMVGIAIRGKAMEAALAILDSPQLSSEVAQQIAADLSTLQPRIELASSLDFADRAMLLDFTLRTLTGRLGGVEDSDAVSKIGLALSVDANIPLKMVNELFDRIVAAAQMNDWQKRDEEIDRIYADIEQLSQQPKPSIYALLRGRDQHSTHMGGVIISLLAPALREPIDASERDQANLTLTKTAAALALYRIEHGSYPAGLDDLVAAGALPELPIDPFTQSPLNYERRDKGYLLYSLGKNRADDEGSDLTRAIAAGEWVLPADHVSPSPNDCDLAIRVPLPPLELPPQPAVESDEASILPFLLSPP